MRTIRNMAGKAVGEIDRAAARWLEGLGQPEENRARDVVRLRVLSLGALAAAAATPLALSLVLPLSLALPVGATGELCTRGYSVMLGYWEDEARTRETIRDGWMHTGDLATIDEQGYCNIVGRVKDMVIRGGENLYPREIEEFLFRHPKVQAVQVFGVPDPKYGEELCAWIVLKPGQSATEDEIREFCRDQIAHYKIPRYVRFVHDMPMTVTGKVQKFVMRETMIRELGLEPAATA